MAKAKREIQDFFSNSKFRLEAQEWFHVIPHNPKGVLSYDCGQMANLRCNLFELPRRIITSKNYSVTEREWSKKSMAVWDSIHRSRFLQEFLELTYREKTG